MRLIGKEMICKSCETIDKPKTITKGSFFIEIILWISFLIPGLIYTLWRLTTTYQGCRHCDSTELVPQDSPAGKRIIDSLKEDAS